MGKKPISKSEKTSPRQFPRFRNTGLPARLDSLLEESKKDQQSTIQKQKNRQQRNDNNTNRDKLNNTLDKLNFGSYSKDQTANKYQPPTSRVTTAGN